MKIIHRPRGQGKTTEVIKMSAKDNLYIVCMSQMECKRIFAQARTMGLDIPFPLTFDEFRGRDYYKGGIKGLLIDNAELLLQYMASVPIVAITINDSSKQTIRGETDE